ncbi:hypothetical protein VTN00DRAFT_8425 [Thermoascus crustaceus]|uniref:uncharacterized protein n=1 Tax=Thermoascus crustaceus TaxID=5088 RepID=UPI003742D4E4
MANVENSRNDDLQKLYLDETLPEISTDPGWGGNFVKHDSGSGRSLLSLRQALSTDPSKGNRKSADLSQQGNKGEMPLLQKAVADCTRLRLCMDIRLGPGETWAMQEGSLVICIDPIYTILNHDVLAQDEFELVHGDVYVVCRMYADMWALCARISFHSPIEASPTMAKSKATPKGAGNLAFIPLCSVTLAANFSAFIRRCSEYGQNPHETPRFPGNGLLVKPPERSHSLNASHEIFQESRPRLRLPNMMFEVCNSFSSEKSGKGFIALDHHPQHTTSRVRSGGKVRLGQLERSMTLRRVWNKLRSSESSASAPAELDTYRKPAENPLSPVQTASSQESQGARKGKVSGSRGSSSAGEDTKPQPETTQREREGKRRKSMRDLIFGEEKSRSGSERGSAQSDASIIKENIEFR